MDERELMIELELEPGADTEEIEQAGRQLRARLLELDVEAVRPVPVSQEPDGAKGTAVDWSQLVLTLSAAGGVSTSLITLARHWLGQHAATQRLKITIENDTIELERATSEERGQLISAWIQRHEDK